MMHRTFFLNLQYLLLLSGLVFLNTFSFGQTKYEREYRIGAEAAPAKARTCIESLFPGERIKWYYEENLVGNSVEAKVRWEGTRVSVEFDTLGALQDIEIELKWREVPATVQSRIEVKLEEYFSRYTIRKIQRQYGGQNPVDLFLKDQQGESKYELVVKGRNREGVNLYEITFDTSGEILSHKTIIFRNTDNLEY